jgi:hypothetical protein
MHIHAEEHKSDGIDSIADIVRGVTPVAPFPEDGEQGLFVPPGRPELPPRFTYRSGGYYGWWEGGIGAAQNYGEAELWAVPLEIPHACTMLRIGAWVGTQGTAGALLRFGVYADSGDGYPGALLADGGTVSAETGGWKEVTITLPLTRGHYWPAQVTQGAAGTRPITHRVANHTTFRVRGSNGTASFSEASDAPSSGNLSGGGYRTTATVTGALPATYVPSDSQPNAPAMQFLITVP